MRKSLAAFGLVFALLAGFFGYTVVEALDAQDAVSFTVERQLGDPAAAQGFQLNIPTFQNYNMAWDTTLTLGSTPTWSTDYRYDPGNISWYTPQDSSPMLSVAVGDTSMFYISGDDWSTDVIGQAYREIIEDVSSRAPSKGSYSETVVLSDYLEYYPVILSDIPLPDSYSSGWEAWDLTQAFHIPVGQGDTIQVDLELDRDYVISSIYLSTPQAPSLFSEAILSNGYYYVLFNPEQLDGTPVAGASPCGLYRIPASGGQALAVQNCTLCYQTSGLPQRLAVADGGYHLLLLENLAENNYKLLSLDTLSYQPVQEIPVQPPDENHTFIIQDSYLGVLSLSDDYPVPLVQSLELWARNDIGLYVPVLNCDLTQAQFPLGRSFKTYYDGERLVMASYIQTSPTGYMVTPSVSVAVCNSDGLAYSACFIHSQSITGSVLVPDDRLTLTPVS